MEFKEVPFKNNRIFVLIIIPVLIFICISWLILRKYGYFIGYLGITLLLVYLHFFTYYYINDYYLLIKAGFFNMKIKYKDIISVEEYKDKIKVIWKKLNINLYPNNINKFIIEFKNKLNKKVTYIVKEDK